MILSGRPLLATAADRRYLVERPERDQVVRHVRAGLNTLLLGERGMGRTTLLHALEPRIEEELGLTAAYIDARRLGEAAAILIAVRDAVEGPRSALTEAPRRAELMLAPMPTDLRAEEALRVVRELSVPGNERGACILLDDPDPEVAHQLFGRLRDELWQTGLVWVVAGDVGRRSQLLTPPADAFFERVVELAPLNDEQQQDLIKRRLERGDDRALLDVRAKSGSPRALLAALRDATTADSAQATLQQRAERQNRAADLGRLHSMMLAEIEDGAAASASDPEWLRRFGVSRQRAQQVLAELERHELVRAEMLPGPTGRPRKVYRRLEVAE